MDEDYEETKGSKKKVVKAKVEKSKENEDKSNDNKGISESKTKEAKEKYEKMTHKEHVLARPDMYAGSRESTEATMWVVNEELGKMVEEQIKYIPVLYKIFDEILVNASDNKHRDDPELKIKMTYIKVNIDADNGVISVENDGAGIPVEVNKKHNLYNQEMIFGHLLTGSNFDDNEKRVTGGRNGYGAKLANIFSQEFTVESVCDNKSYQQKFEKNMDIIGKPTIGTTKEKNRTKIIFKPDLKYFNMEKLNDGIIKLMKRRVFDVAACKENVKVYLNGQQISANTWLDYSKLFLESEAKAVQMKISDRWEFVVALSNGEGFKHMSFVNGIWTPRGGPHVDHIVDQIVKLVREKATKKNKTLNVKPFQVKANMFLFLKCLIDNPSFDSQTKETLMTKALNFGSTCPLTDQQIKKIMDIGILDRSVEAAEAMAFKTLARGTDGKKSAKVKGIAKLDDANKAGTAKGKDCTLILTEGDSAKSLAVAGLGVVGRDYFGVFPLRGKVLNVREASISSLQKNEEFINIKKILGLQQGKKYDEEEGAWPLRYGHVLIMTDQDHDGSHIKGLLINMFEKLWPDLLKKDEFIQEFITPIIKVTKGKSVTSFYTMPEYDNWKRELGEASSKYQVKYYKGLGTSTAAEAKQYFGDLELHRKNFVWKHHNEENPEIISKQWSETKDCIDLAFSNKRANDRKRWLERFEDGTYIDTTDGTLTYTDFVNKELILYSRADCVRSIPSFVDGLKPGQRKVLYACFKRKLKQEIKVSQLSGYVSEVTSYHHGDVSLQSTIVNLARDFVGSNNLNLLQPLGQFGTRRQGGKDAASARYINTKLSPLARLVFPEHDDKNLKYLDDDGQPIEPEWYAPVLPLVLVNGAEGIGMGYSTKVPSYNPLDIVENLRRAMRGEAMQAMTPWYRDFEGTIRYSAAEDKYYSFGKVYKTPQGTIEITELPVGKWTDDYKEFLQECEEGVGEKIAAKKKKKEANAEQEDQNLNLNQDDGDNNDKDGDDEQKDGKKTKGKGAKKGKTKDKENNKEGKEGKEGD
ncbi:MAG: putative DNA topoisomerase 2, partial [Streblomastix strix]